MEDKTWKLKIARLKKYFHARLLPSSGPVLAGNRQSPSSLLLHFVNLRLYESFSLCISLLFSLYIFLCSLHLYLNTSVSRILSLPLCLPVCLSLCLAPVCQCLSVCVSLSLPLPLSGMVSISVSTFV